MKKTPLILIVFSIISVLSYSQDVKNEYDYEFCIPLKAKKSKIIKNRLLPKREIQESYIKGKIYDYKHEAISYATVAYVNLKDKKVYGMYSDSLGNFKITLNEGIYNFQVRCLGFSTLELKKFTQKHGQSRSIEVILGGASGFLTYGVKSEKEMTKKEIKRLVNKLQKESQE